MSPDDLLKIQEMIDAGGGINALVAILLILVCGVAAYLGSYLKEKGKNVATKEDIEELTERISEVKRKISEKDRIRTIKYEQKYSACLKMLGILDAHLSHTITTGNDGKSVDVDKQYADAEEARKCHNDLLLSIDDQEIIKMFLSILLGKAERPVEVLDKVRSAVRKELGFEGDLYKDPEATWIGVLNCKRRG